jgi:hypothetical protein
MSAWRWPFNARFFWEKEKTSQGNKSGEYGAGGNRVI